MNSSWPDATRPLVRLRRASSCTPRDTSARCYRNGCGGLCEGRGSETETDLLVPPPGKKSGLDVDEVALRVLDQLVDDSVHDVVDFGEEVLVDGDLPAVCGQERTGV